MIKSSIFSLPSLLLRSFPIRTIAISQKVLSDEVWNKNVAFQFEQLEKREKESLAYKDMIDEKTKRWKEKIEIYYGKERDLVNYPMMTMPDYHPKVRIGFLPDEWFNALYSRTGVTGPYLFLWGGILFLMQKEFLVYEHNLFYVPSFCGAMYFLHYKFGATIAAYTKNINDKKLWAIATRPKQVYKKLADQRITRATANKAAAEVVVDLMAVAKDNVGLQLENVYRSRLAEVHRSVTSRLEYQVEKEMSKLRYQKQHMIEWIVSSVIKDFSAQQEKAALTQCIADLRVLAQQSKSASI